MDQERKPISLKVWWLAMRPFSFPASAMPVIFGTVLAVTVGGASFRAGYFILALIGMLILHGASNILNDVYDFRKGLDREVLPVSGAVVRRLLTPETAWKGSLLLFGCGGLIGIYLAAAIGWPIWIIGGVGVAIGVFYSADPLEFKYHALGDLAVLCDFGLLGSLGAWTVQTGQISWIPVVWATPIALLIVGILHANNWRDIAGDANFKCVTVASALGDRNSERYYAALLFLPYGLVLSFALITNLGAFGPQMPLSCILTFLSLPLALKLRQKAALRRESKNPLDFLGLDGATAQLSLCFGALYAAAFLLDKWLIQIR